MKNPYSQELTNFITLIPKHLRKFIKEGVFMIPAQHLIADYYHKKATYLATIETSKKPSENSMHKYTSTMPIQLEDIQSINKKCFNPLKQYCSLYLKQYQVVSEFNSQMPGYHGGFAITYNEGHKGLAIHKDDSCYTVNICLNNQAQGNQVVFNECMTIGMIEDMACIHPGQVPHRTEDLKSGTRTNVVIWFK